MFQEIPVSENNIFAFKATGKLTDEDYQKFLPRLTTLIHKYGPLSLLIELEDFKGWDLKAAWDDFKFGTEHEKDFERIAIVSEKRWHGWITRLGNLMTRTEVRFFPRDELQEAWDWLREGDVAEEEVEEKPPEITIAPYRHILVAVDFSRYSEAALKRAIELAKHYDARLSLINAVEHIVFPAGDTDGVIVPYDYIKDDQLLFESAEARLRKVAESADYPDLQYKVLWGTPKSAILSYAEAQNVDLIVAGSHGRHGLARLMGSTTTALVHSARTDVVVVRINE